jgi:hypothetical protein
VPNRTQFEQDASSTAFASVRQTRILVVRTMSSQIETAKTQLREIAQVAEAPALQVLDRCHQVLNATAGMGHRLNSTAETVQAFPKYVTPLIDDFFSNESVHWIILVAFCGLLVSACTAWWGLHITHYEDDIEEEARQNDEALKLLCSFHRNVPELDVTTRESFIRPCQRLWMRIVFVVRYARTLVIGMIVLTGLQVAILVQTVMVLANVVIMWVPTKAVGNTCKEPEMAILSDEELCTSTIHDLRKVLEGYKLMPKNSVDCVESHLLLCSDFFWPLSSWLAALATGLVLSILCLLWLAMAMPRELKGCFQSLAYQLVEEKVASKEEEAKPSRALFGGDAVLSSSSS